jgi:hypothetical protein
MVAGGEATSLALSMLGDAADEVVGDAGIED